MIKKIVLSFLLFSTSVFAQNVEYAIPGGTIATGEQPCIEGYICLHSVTPQTFGIGSLSFPPPFLQIATPAQLAALNIIPVVETPQPGQATQNILGHSMQLINGVPTIVWTTAPFSAAQIAQNFFNSAISAGITITSASTPALNGTYGVDPGTRSNAQGLVFNYVNRGGFPHGASTYQYADINGGFHAVTLAQLQAIVNAGEDYVSDLGQALLTAQAGGVPNWPSANVTIP